jgi:HSP20 family molecular chaperone IbpA
MPRFRRIVLEELARIQERINGLFEQAVLAADQEGRGEGVPGTWSPVVDLIETADSYLLLAELPGVRREDLQLQVLERRLELSGRRQPLAESKGFLRMERSYGPFRRTVDFAAPVAADGITAGLEQGILRIHVPKQAPKQATRRADAAALRASAPSLSPISEEP